MNLLGHSKSDLSEWMLNQQRQFQEFDRSFGTNMGFGDSFDGFFTPFSRSSLALQSHQPTLPSPPHSHSTNMIPDRTLVRSGEMEPKAAVTYDQDKFEVQFNVEDYTPEELSIKTEGDVLIVVAKHLTNPDNAQSFVSKQFEQRFTLPSGVNIEKIASSLSKDGILTVSAPRENLPMASYQKKEAIENKGGQAYNQSEGLPQPKVSYDDDKFQISLDVKSYSPEDLDVKVEDNTIIITAKQEVQESGGNRKRVFEQKFSLPAGVKAELVKSSLTRDGMLVVTAPKLNIPNKKTYTEPIENTMDKILDPSSWESDRRRDLPFDDRKSKSSFGDMRREPAYNSLLSNRNEDFFDTPRPSLFDKKTVFDQSRTHSLFNPNNRSLVDAGDQQNGISQIQYDDDMYKILVNVENYKPEELVIKTVDNTVIVEAKHEEKTSDGHSYATQSFNQSFTLPTGIRPESVTSGLSKEGVLTISAPLPKAVNSSSERVLPIKHY